jgi:integrase
MFKALSDLLLADVSVATRIPQLIADWEAEVMPRHAAKTRRDETARGKVIAASFIEFEACQVQARHISEFLAAFRSKPRTHNLYRSQIRELMRFAIEKGLRTENPVDHIRTMSEKARERYLTDSELRRVKVAALRGADGLDTRSGPMLCALIDMAYLTGQRISDLLSLEWAQVGDEGISFRQAKTGAKVLVTWTPRLAEVVERLRKLREDRGARTPKVFTTQDGRAYTYWGASTAWRRALARAKVADAHFHDLRAKAGTDKERREGMQAARLLLGHTTEQQTSDYVRGKTARKISGTR